eukprot:scaffold13021_cov127-Isochrysis_galbana.AAC.6
MASVVRATESSSCSAAVSPSLACNGVGLGASAPAGVDLKAKSVPASCLRVSSRFIREPDKLWGLTAALSGSGSCRAASASTLSSDMATCISESASQRERPLGGSPLARAE